jgi:hypothetical protein
MRIEKNDGLFFSLRVVVPAGMPGRELACLVSLTLRVGLLRNSSHRETEDSRGSVLQPGPPMR